MQNRTAANYLSDLGQLVKEKALEAKTVHEESVDAYSSGYLMAYYEMVSLMQSQANAFAIPLDEISQADIKPDSDLL